jgi:hypothetical protein
MTLAPVNAAWYVTGTMPLNSIFPVADTSPPP